MFRREASNRDKNIHGWEASAGQDICVSRLVAHLILAIQRGIPDISLGQYFRASCLYSLRTHSQIAWYRGRGKVPVRRISPNKRSIFVISCVIRSRKKGWITPVLVALFNLVRRTCLG